MTDKRAPIAGADTRLGKLSQSLRAMYPQLIVEPGAGSKPASEPAPAPRAD